MNGDQYARVIGQVQFGPVYRCWICGEPVARLVPYHEWLPPPTAMDRYADHLAYLDLSFECKQRCHPSRVAMVGPAVTPVDWPRGAPTAERVQAIQEAITLLAAKLQDKQAVGRLEGFDDVLALSLRLYGRAMNPAQGAGEIRALVTQAIDAVVSPLPPALAVAGVSR